MKRATRTTIRFSRYLSLLAVAALVAAMLVAAGCAADQEPAPSDGGNGAQAQLVPVTIGTLKTDDILPLWVAENEGLLEEAGLDVTIEVFPSALEQIAAISAGQIDGMMTDMVVPLNLIDGGVPVRAAWAMQSAPAGIVASADSGITQVSQLAGVKTGNSSGTILEYIYDRALTDAGVPADQIVTEEVKKLDVRLSLLMSGQVDAAVLPWTLFGAAVGGGGVPVLGPEQAQPYSQTVLEFSEAFLAQEGAEATVDELRKQWNAGVAIVNADPNAQRELLGVKTDLGERLANYPVRTYPEAALPDRDKFEDVVEWMVQRGYLDAPIAYEDLVYVTQ